MMKPLRKKHLLTWQILAVLLPAAITIAWLSVPGKASQSLVQPGAASPLPVILRQMSNTNYSVQLRANADTSLLQLQWDNKNILQYPSATIYAVDPATGNRDKKSIGRIEARGHWFFPLDASFKSKSRFILYDFIHQQVIDTINLLP